MAISVATLESEWTLAERNEERTGVRSENGSEVVGSRWKCELDIGLSSRHVGREVVIEFAVSTSARFTLCEDVADPDISSSSVVIEFAVLEIRPIESALLLARSFSQHHQTHLVLTL